MNKKISLILSLIIATGMIPTQQTTNATVSNTETNEQIKNISNVSFNTLKETTNTLKETTTKSIIKENITKKPENLNVVNDFKINNNDFKNNVLTLYRKSVNTTELQNLINKIELLNKDEYIDKTWDQMNIKYQEAKNILVLPNVTQNQINESYYNLLRSYLNLRLKPNKDKLNDLINKLSQLNKENYTEESWKIFSNQLNIAIDVLNNKNSDSNDFENSYKKLIDEYNKLEEKIVVNKSELNRLIETISNLQQDEYIQSTWELLQEPYNIAINISNNNNSTQNDVDLAFENLTKAYLNLRLKPNKAKLDELINSIKSYNKENYTIESWNELQIQYQFAIETKNNENSNQQQIDNATMLLQDAINNLTIIDIVQADKSQLNSFVTQYAAKVDREQYMQNSLINFDNAYNNALQILNNEKATQSQVDQAYNELVKSYIGLRLKPNKDKLNDLINKVESLNQNNYTIDSWNNLQCQLNNSINVLNNDNVTQNDIDLACNNLKIAINNLQEFKKGDLNKDGKIDVMDLSIASKHYGKNMPEFDLNNDGIVNEFEIQYISNEMLNQ